MWWWIGAVAWAQCEEVATLPIVLVTAEDAPSTAPPLRAEDALVAYEVITPEGCNTPCDDVLVLDLELEPPLADPDEDPEALGYIVRVVAGALPPAITLPDTPFAGTTLQFRWPVPREQLLAAIEVVLEVRTVDGAGNESGGNLEVEIRREALPAVLASCSHAPGVAPWAWLGLLGVTRRRRAADQRTVQTAGTWSK